MAKTKYCKVNVAISIGNRSSKITDPVDLGEEPVSDNSFDGELNTLVMNFLDAVIALPVSGTSYTRDSLITAVCNCFELQRIPTE